MTSSADRPDSAILPGIGHESARDRVFSLTQPDWPRFSATTHRPHCLTGDVSAVRRRAVRDE